MSSEFSQLLELINCSEDQPPVKFHATLNMDIDNIPEA